MELTTKKKTVQEQYHEDAAEKNMEEKKECDEETEYRYARNSEN